MTSCQISLWQTLRPSSYVFPNSLIVFIALFFFFPVPYGHVYICRPCFSFFSFQFVLMSEYQRHVTFQGKVLHFSVSFLFWDFLLPWMIFPWKRNSLFLGWDFFWASILVRRLLPCNSGFVLSLLGISLGFKPNNIFLRLQYCSISHIEFKNPWSYFGVKTCDLHLNWMWLPNCNIFCSNPVTEAYISCQQNFFWDHMITWCCNCYCSTSILLEFHI